MLSITGLGRLTKEPEMRFTSSGAGVCTLSVAFDTTYNKAEKKMNTTFLNVIVWNRGENKLAERCNDRLAKGSQIVVEGTIQTRNYEVKDGSGKRYVTELIADKVHFVGAKVEKSEKSESLDFDDFGSVIDYSELPL